MLTVSEQMAHFETKRKAPNRPPLDASALKLIDSFVTKDAASGAMRNRLVKALEALPVAERAPHLMALAIANPVKFH